MLRRAGEFVRQRIDVTTLLMPMCSARSKSTSCHSSITGSAAFTTVNAFPRARSPNSKIDYAPSSLRAVRGINTGGSFKHLSELSAVEPRGALGAGYAYPGCAAPIIRMAHENEKRSDRKD